MKPVYIINGFLDAGKTDFFRYTIAQPYFRTKGKTLLIVFCRPVEIPHVHTEIAEFVVTKRQVAPRLHSAGLFRQLCTQSKRLSIEFLCAGYITLVSADNAELVVTH